ncbi:MAG TPA: substrate-binding domain-containing protein [Steroidobacteraceae bacterium]|nr:substrate-binding domain-containing protein [Steroidobacteraceae bacterium]
MGMGAVVLLAVAVLMAAALVPAHTVSATEQTTPRYITVASTTSTENSGLFAHLLPIFESRTGIAVRVVALGTGQALDVARRGDVDVVFVHDRVAEDRFVAEGHGLGRRDVMYNDFVLVGPRRDPARVAGGNDVAAALRAIQRAQAPFVSRSDRSGTHAAELRSWADAGVDIEASKGPWYRETGSGMGAALNVASSMDAYVLADRATWLAFTNRGSLQVLVQGDARLANQYGVILVNPARHPHVKQADAQAFIDWLLSTSGQAAIAAFRIHGEQAFFPGAHPQAQAP